MYCKNCGYPNEENAWKCTQCGTELRAAPPASAASTPAPAALMPAATAPVPIPNYLVPAIICSVLCCWPVNMLGIPAIVYAARVNTKVLQGDLAGAKADSKNAKMWCWITFILEAFGILAYIGVYVALFTAGALSNIHP